MYLADNRPWFTTEDVGHCTAPISQLRLSAGDMNQIIADMEGPPPALDAVSEEQHLRDIWQELGVGQSGSLSLSELSTVCEHIGMEQMNPEV